MHLAVDVHYPSEGQAIAAGVAFADWTSPKIESSEVVHLDNVQPYRSGSFYERELPCILALLVRFEERPATIIIDGYVTLGPDSRDGLGAHLFHALDGKVPVIGVAKSRFEGTPVECELLRGTSERPLYVTCCGLPLAEAKRLILSMHGEHRLPTLLSAVDGLCRRPPVEDKPNERLG